MEKKAFQDQAAVKLQYSPQRPFRGTARIRQYNDIPVFFIKNSPHSLEEAGIWMFRDLILRKRVVLWMPRALAVLRRFH